MKTCLFCGAKIKNPRSNKKFCNSKCRDRERYPRKHKKYLNKLYSNPDFHKEQLEIYKKRNHKRYKENKEIILELNKKSYLKRRDKILQKQNKKYADKVKKLKKQIGKKMCIECGKEFTNRFYFCSDECSEKNWKRKNMKKIRRKAKEYSIINSERISENGKRNRNENKSRKKRVDKEWYTNNYDRVRMMSRIREILNGNFPHNYNNQEEILLRDISYLKQRIKELKNEAGLNEKNIALV